MDDKKLRKFKLIDREGYLNAHPDNKQLLAKHFVDDVVAGYMNMGDLLIRGFWVAIKTTEFKFFEEITGGE